MPTTLLDQSATTPIPPSPSDPHELARVDHTRLRRRLLYGVWEDDLRTRLLLLLGEARSEAWKAADMSANVFRSSVQQISTLYDRAVTVTGDDELAARIQAAGLWQLMQRGQRDTIGMRELYQRVDVVHGSLVYRPVFADMVEASAPPDTPEQPTRLAELQLREHPATGRQLWVWERWDISDPAAPSVRVTDDQGLDVSPLYLVAADGSPSPPGGLRGDAFAWRRADGQPLLPYVALHAAKTGQLFDPYEARELVEGTLTCACLWSFFVHAALTASWPQRYGINVDLSGGVTGTDGSTRSRVRLDPATLALFVSAEEAEGQPIIGQFSAGADLSGLVTAIALYERRLAAFAGVSPADVQRVAGDPRSGFALSINLAGKREAAAKFAPIFAANDAATVALSAVLLNRATGTSYPEDGYRVTYRKIPLSAEELTARRTHLVELVDQGLMSRVDAYRELNDVTEAEAVVDLEEIQQINARFRGA